MRLTAKPTAQMAAKPTAFALTTLIAWAIAFACPLQADEPSRIDLISVNLADGRTWVGFIDSRTDSSSLWVRIETPTMTMSRRIDWRHVTGAMVGGNWFDADRLRDRVSGVATPERRPESIPRGSGTLGAESASPRRDTLAMPARETPWVMPRVTGFSVDAQLANWDADIEQDGLAVLVAPFAPGHRLVPVSGTVDVQLLAPLRQTFDSVPQGRGQSLEIIGRWTRPLHASQFTADGVELLLPFEPYQPESDRRVGSVGMLQVRLVVPGHGVFERRIDVVRIRPFSPLRDR